MLCVRSSICFCVMPTLCPSVSLVARSRAFVASSCCVSSVFFWSAAAIFFSASARWFCSPYDHTRPPSAASSATATTPSNAPPTVLCSTYVSSLIQFSSFLQSLDASSWQSPPAPVLPSDGGPIRNYNLSGVHLDLFHAATRRMHRRSRHHRPLPRPRTPPSRRPGHRPRPLRPTHRSLHRRRR